MSECPDPDRIFKSIQTKYEDNTVPHDVGFFEDILSQSFALIGY
jgi:hypothetical protein